MKKICLNCGYTFEAINKDEDVCSNCQKKFIDEQRQVKFNKNKNTHGYTFGSFIAEMAVLGIVGLTILAIIFYLVMLF
jgi:protein-arginine kinase activator protein McsA